MDVHDLVNQQDYVLLGVFVLLLLMSVLTWVIILLRTVKLWWAKVANKKFSRSFWQAKTLQAATEQIGRIHGPMSRVALESYTAQCAYHEQPYRRLQDAVPLNEYLSRRIRHSRNNSLRPFSNGLTALASIGATAPFIGLFGTVWGIYHALINIGLAGQVTIAAVSAPIGEALIATAAGLFVAIPAVLAYNALVRANRNLAYDVDNFSHDLHVQLLNEGHTR